MSGISKRSSIGVATFLFLLALSVGTVTAELQDPIVLPEFEKKSLLNGMQILFLDGKFERIPFLLMIKNGAAFDPSDKWGATYLMARMMIQNLERDQTKEELEARKIELDFKVDWDAIYFLGSSPLDSLYFALAVLAEIVVRPEFDEETFASVRNNVLDEVLQTPSLLEIRTQALFCQKLFSENPYAHPIRGTHETLENLQLNDLKVQFRRLIMPNQTQLAFYYEDNRDELFRRLSRRWGGWVKGKPAPFTFFRASKPEQAKSVLVDVPAGEESLIRLGYLGVSKDSKDYYALKVLEQYLTLSLSDWAKEISAQSQIRGRATLEARRMPGYLQVSIQSSRSEIASYYRQITESINALSSGQIDVERFEEARSLVLNEFKRSLDEPVGRLQQLLGTDLYQLGVNHIPTFGLRLQRVTPEVLQRAVKAYLPSERFVMVVTAPVGTLKPVLEEIGQVEVLN